MKKVVFAVVLLALTAPLLAQTTFQRTYGGTDYDEGRSVTQTADGGYVITGWTESFGAGSTDVYLVKTDASGDTTWTRTFGGTDGDYGWSVAQTVDGGYIIAGSTESFGAGRYDAWLVKTAFSGDTMWTRTYGDTSYNYGLSVAQTADDGYIITGYTYSFGTSWADFWLIKTDASGNTLWTRTFGGTGADEGWSVAQTTDGGYVITGYTEFFGANQHDIWLIKTDASGDTMWTRTYGGTGFESGYSVALTADGGYVITGITNSYGAGRDDAWLIKTDAFGDTMWTRTYGGTGIDYAYSVRQTTDGGYVIAGYTDSFGAGSRDVWLVKTDSAGNATAIAEPQPPVAHKPAPATIVRAVLHMQETAIRHSSFALLNSAGRKVMDLHPGDNDVRHLSPGVYFVREASGVERQASDVRKVILTR